jgi:CCR4-NOT transcription complex subunit 1
MQKLTRMPSQAAKIADALDTNTDGDLFKDFDLSTFMDHFRLDPTAKVTLALACKLVSKQDIKTKGIYSDTCPPEILFTKSRC